MHDVLYNKNLISLNSNIICCVYLDFVTIEPYSFIGEVLKKEPLVNLYRILSNSFNYDETNPNRVYKCFIF